MECSFIDNINHFEHKNFNYYCESCNDLPICEECLPIHKKNSIKLFNQEKKEEFISFFKESSDTYQLEIIFLKNELKHISNHYKQTQARSEQILNQIKEKFKNTIKLPQDEENKIFKQIESIQNENTKSFDKLKKEIENKIRILENILIKVNNATNNQEQFSEICNFIYQINGVNHDLPPFQNIINQFKQIYFKELNQSNGKIEYLIDYHNLIHYNLNSYIFNKINFILSDNKVLNQIFNKNFLTGYAISDKFNTLPNDANIHFDKLLCYDMESIPENLPSSIITLLLHNISEPIQFEKLPLVPFLYINSYHHCLEPKSIRFGLENLYLNNIDQIVIDSIPSSIKQLYIGNYVSYSLHSKIIPSSVERLELFNVILEPGCIPSSVKWLKISNVNHIVKGVIPDSVDHLILENILEPLETGTIPPSVRWLKLIKFNQIIEKDIIPESVNTLLIDSISQQLKEFSIPPSVYSLTLGKGFNQPIVNDIIPSSVTKLYISKIKQPLCDISIPESITKLTILDKFDQQLNKNSIRSNSIRILELHNIKQPLQTDSIPSSVYQIILGNGYNQPIIKDLIPSTVKELHYNWASTLNVSISNIEKVYLKNCKHPITHELINSNFEMVKELYLSNQQFRSLNKNLISNKIKIIVE